MIFFRKKEKEAKKEKFLDSFVVAIVIAMVIKAFILQTYTIPSGSMLETLQLGDFIIVNRLSYSFSQPQNNDVIVFEYPLDPTKDFIKRVIGVPGDKVKLVDKTLWINGQIKDEPYKKITNSMSLEGEITTKDNFEEFVVPEGVVFVMGDNRDNSYDSRFWGFVPIDKIKGKALITYWSLITPEDGSAWSKAPLSTFRFLNPKYTRFDRVFRRIH